MIGIARKLKSFGKSEQTQFAQLWVVVKYDFKNSQYFFCKMSERTGFLLILF